MHGYYWKRLNKLAEFDGGQFSMETKEGLVFRGEIRDCYAPNDKNKRVLISFNWLSERRFVLDNYWKSRPKWYLIETPTGSPYLDVRFTTYYSQPDEDRIKMWGELGEICRFFKKGDHSNLVRCGDEFVPFCSLHELKFWQAIIVALSIKK